MRRALTWLAGLAGIAALLRRRSRQRAAAPQSTAALSTPSADPVVELRQKLEETRTADPAPSAGVEPSFSLDERRARVHERAQDAINLMHSPNDDPAGDDPSTDEGDSR